MTHTHMPLACFVLVTPMFRRSALLVVCYSLDTAWPVPQKALPEPRQNMSERAAPKDTPLHTLKYICKGNDCSCLVPTLLTARCLPTHTAHALLLTLLSTGHTNRRSSLPRCKAA